MSFELIFREKNRVLRVCELNLAIRQLIEGHVPLLWVRGEISNLVKAASGHCYFSLKDEQAQVRCVMFRHKHQLLARPLGNGQLVEALAVASLYEQRGDFQLTVEQMRPAGLGVLYEQFEQLKQTLAAEGLFAQARKRALPRYPRRIGIVTSPQAAALRDVLATLRTRLPGVPVVLYPAPVQGQGSGEKIAAAITAANRRSECDVLILCRGGGSMEDLWAFNEEVVARAIAASALPVVSGVGHETDFTIADFVADERAPTPTAAAQRVVPDRLALRDGLDETALHLRRALRNRLHNAMQALDFLQRRLVHPAQQLQRRAQDLQRLQQGLRRAHLHGVQLQVLRWQALQQRLGVARAIFNAQQQRRDALGQRLRNALREILRQQAARVSQAGQHLDMLDPRQVLARGYSLVRDGQGRVVRDPHALAQGEDVHITFAHGWARAGLKDKGYTS